MEFMSGKKVVVFEPDTAGVDCELVSDCMLVLER
jgi:hypothetical protein